MADIVDDVLDGDTADEPSSLFQGLDWLGMPSSAKQQVPAAPPRFALKPLSSNTQPAAAKNSLHLAAKTSAAAAVTKVHSRQPRSAQTQPAAGLQLPNLNTHVLLQAGLGKSSPHPLPALPGVNTKPAAAAGLTLPVLQHSKPVQPACQHKTPAQSVFDDFPADESDEDQTPCRTAAAATAAKHQLSTLQQNKSARTTDSSKHTDQQQQRSTLKLSLDLFSSKPNNSQQQQERGSNPVATFSRTASKGPGRAGTGAAAVAHSWLQPLPGLVSTPADSPAVDAAGIASSRGKQARSKPHPSTADKALLQAHKPETAGNISRPSTHQQTTTATFSLPGLAARQPSRPKAPPGAAAATAGAALLSLKPATATGVGAAAASKGGVSLQQLGGLGCQITSAEGELELVMLSPVGPAAAVADTGHESIASLEDSQQQRRQKQRQRSRTKQQQPKPVSEFDLAGNSQGSGSAGDLKEGRDAAADSSGCSQSASLSGAGSASVNEAISVGESASDADVAASPSSGEGDSLWSGGSSAAAADGSSDSEGGGDDSDGGFVETGGKRKQTGRGGGRQAGARAKARKALQDDDAATAAAGAKARKVVRFADDADDVLLAADGRKQQQAKRQQEGCRTSSSSLKASSKAAGAAAVLDLGAVLPGEVPLFLPSGRGLTRIDTLLVELPAGFDAEGDAGAIGRVVCTPAAAGAASTDCKAAARVASRVQDKQGKGRNSTKAAAGNSGSDDACSSGSLDVQSDIADASQSESQSSDGHVNQSEGIPALDMKGTMYDIQELLLAGTAAMVRINAPGKGAGAKPASAHMEHLLGSFLRAVPSAAADQDCNEAFEYDWEVDEDCYGDDPTATGGGAGGARGKGAAGRGRCRAGGKKGRGGLDIGGLCLGGVGRKGRGGGGAKKKSSSSRGIAKKRGGGGGRAKAAADGRGTMAAGATAAVGRDSADVAGGAGGSKGSSKARKKDPWETDSGDSE